MFTVYKHTTPSGKVYIGITSQKTNRRWSKGAGYKEHCYFYRAVRKYGWDNIKHEILFENLTKEEAEQKEIDLIRQYRSNDSRYGYNATAGGESNVGASNPMYGHRHNDEAKMKMRVKKLGHKQSVEQVEMRVSQLRGRKQRPEAIANAAAAKMKPVICIETGNVYRGMKEAVKQTGCNYSKISECCHGKRKTTGGFHWAFYSVNSVIGDPEEEEQ